MKVLLKYLLCAAALLACPVLRAQMGNDPYADAAEENEAEANRTVEPYTNLLTVDEPYRLVRNVLLVGEGEWLRAFGPYGGNADGGASYAAVVNRYAEAFPEVQVYCMPIPTASEFYTPYEAEQYIRSQARVINNIFSKLVPEVKAVDVYTTLSHHVSEDIYARTDHHWLPLGAYYAARKLAAVAGLPFKGLDTYDRKVVHGFVGTMYLYSKDEAVKNAPEDFVYYVPREVDITTTYVNYSLDRSRTRVVSASEPYQGRFFLTYPDGSAAAYCTYMGGDTKLTKVETTTPNGRKLLILKDSFGNALPAFLFYSFEEIHVADCRYFTGSIKDYVRQNGITDILFANNMEHVGMHRVINNYNEFLDR